MKNTGLKVSIYAGGNMSGKRKGKNQSLKSITFPIAPPHLAHAIATITQGHTSYG